jgi:hypothetical protein
MKYLVLFENFQSFDRKDYINKIWYWYSESAFDNPFESREELESLSDEELINIYEEMVEDFESEDDSEYYDEFHSSIDFNEKKSYKGTKGGLDKWFKEKWVDISKTNPDGSHPPCGRSDTSKGGYPKCRKVRVAARMTKKQKKASVARKRRVEKEGSKGSGRKPNYAK